MTTKPKIISGKDFMEKYVSTESGILEYAVFRKGAPLGECLGKGRYFSFHRHSADHYSEDEYCVGVGECGLKDDAKIMVLKNSHKHSGSEIKKFALKHGVDGAFDLKEYERYVLGKDADVPYLGLVIYNPKVLVEP